MTDPFMINLLSEVEPWFDPNLAGGILGGGVGVLGAVYGTLVGVWFSLLLPGVLLVVLMGCMTPVIKLRYRQAEHRRLQAEEFRRG